MCYLLRDILRRKLMCFTIFMFVLVLANYASGQIASAPIPVDGSEYGDSWVQLGWSAVAGAVSYNVYFGDSPADAVTGGTYMGKVTTTTFVIGFPGYPYPDGLVPGTTYYWRIDVVRSGGSVYKGDVWSFMVVPRYASNPSPADGAGCVATDVELTWSPGFNAVSHDVYFGTDRTEVAQGTANTFKGNRSMAIYAPLVLTEYTTYYWRIDEIDSHGIKHQGNVWIFTCYPSMYGPFMVRNINVSGDSSPNPTISPMTVTNVHGTLFFCADDGTHGFELWKSDGTEAGTVMVKDISPNFQANSHPRYLTNVNGTVFFHAIDDTHGFALWKSDGTEAGTVMVKDISFPLGPFYYPSQTNVNGTFFFCATDGTHGYELWKSDGTEAGTVMVKDINLDSASFPDNLTNVSGTLFFKASDGIHMSELWRSDGTAAGTVMVKDINPTDSSSNIRYLTNVHGILFFSATDGTHGEELWRSDGTEAGTVMVKDINPNFQQSSYPNYLTNMNGTLFFSADDGTQEELWRSDGTEAGTVMVKDVNPNFQQSSYPSYLTNVNGTLFFQAHDGANGHVLWRSDGTEAGTVVVKDINPTLPTHGPSASPHLSELINVNGILLFSAYDGTHGHELWRSDGTEAGTVMVKDIHPHTWYTSTHYQGPTQLTNANGTLFFFADDSTHGKELWTYKPCPCTSEIVNLLANGGFEDGVHNPWSTYGDASLEVVTGLVGTTVPEAPAEGDYCLHVTVGSAGANFWDAGLQHAGHVFEAGKSYTLSAYLKAKEGTMDINFKPELAADPWTGYGSQAFTMTDTWAEYTVNTGVIPENVDPATITFHIGFAPGEFWIDGVRFYEGDYVPPSF